MEVAMSVLAATHKAGVAFGSKLAKKGDVLKWKRGTWHALIPDSAVFQRRLGALPLASYQAGENVLTAGSRRGQLLILKKGAVSIRLAQRRYLR